MKNFRFVKSGIYLKHLGMFSEMLIKAPTVTDCSKFDFISHLHVELFFNKLERPEDLNFFISIFLALQNTHDVINQKKNYCQCIMPLKHFSCSEA